MFWSNIIMLTVRYTVNTLFALLYSTYQEVLYNIQVLIVVKEQVGTALESQPVTFEEFRTRLARLTYAEITNIWQQKRRDKEEVESQAKPIQLVN